MLPSGESLILHMRRHTHTPTLFYHGYHLTRNKKIKKIKCHAAPERIASEYQCCRSSMRNLENVHGGANETPLRLLAFHLGALAF